MLYLPSFIKIGSGIQKLNRGIYRHTDIQVAWRSNKYIYFFKIKKVD